MKLENNAQPPIKGQRILLRGFDTDEEPKVKSTLQGHGYQVVSSMAVADVLVVGMGGATTAIEAAQKAKILLVSWTDFQSRMCGAGSQLPAVELTRLPAIEVADGSVRVLDQVLPRAGVKSPLVPPADLFRHLCLDGCFLRNVRAVALGVRHGLPVALEGETAASKTTAILWLAHLIGRPVVRLNLHGQSDSGELIGRYVPNADRNGEAHGSGHQQSLVALGHKTLDRATPGFDAPAGWNMSKNSGETPQRTRPSWRFHEGYIPQAMRHGWWVLLDEINLAEPQVLERLDPVIEQPPSLVLAESDGTMFGICGTVQVAPGFHMFATLNPADYAGRSVLSPAFRDRWQIWYQAESPGESDFAAMLRCLIFGEQPELTFGGKRYQAPPTQPIYPELASATGIREVLTQLALFHSSLCHAAGMGGAAPALGRLRRERYVFSRRTLLTCLSVLHRARTENADVLFKTQIREAIETVYLNRIRDAADRHAAVALLRAAGLSEE